MSRLIVLYYVLYFYVVFFIVKSLTLWFALFKPKKNPNKIVYLELMGPPMAGYTARSKYWSDLLNAKGYFSEVLSLTTYQFCKECMKKSYGITRIHLATIWKRVVQCLRSRDAAILIVRREALIHNDYGNLFVEKLLRKIHHYLVLDFDDDLASAKWEGQRTHSLYSCLMMENLYKFTQSLKYYDAFICGTSYLKEHFFQYTQHAQAQLILPTCVPHFKAPLKKYNADVKMINIGWVGSSYNLATIESIFPILEEVYKKHTFQFVLICDENTALQQAFPIKYIKWSEEKESENLLQIDIGLMPLMNTNATKGKSAMKLLQYMAWGIVPVASAITVNTEIVQDDINGFLVYDEQQWETVLLKALTNNNRFQKMGEKAFQTISERYTFEANESNFLNFIHKLVSNN